MNEWIGCTECATHKHGGNIPSEGSTTASILVLGLCPGANELKAKKNFVGKSGVLLNSVLQKVMLDRKDLYITNICKCYNPIGRKVSVVTIRKCQKYFEQELQDIKPKVVVCLGATAGSFFQEKSLSGSYYYDYETLTWVIFTHHPSKIVKLHSRDMEEELVQAFLLAKDLQDTIPEVTPPGVVKIKTIQDLVSYKQEILDLKYMSIDCETQGLNFCKDKILTIGISDGENCYGILFNDLTKDIIKELLESDVPKIFFHGKFDTKFLKRAGIEVKNIVFDPMLAYSIIDPISKFYSLESLSLKYLHTTFEKDKIDYEKMFKDGITEEEINILLDRGAWDGYLTFQLYSIFKPLIDKDYKTLFYDLTMPTNEVLTEMEYTGILIDKTKLVECEQWLDCQMKSILSDLNTFPEVQEFLSKNNTTQLNINSPKQVSELLYKFCKIIPINKKESTAKDVLDTISNNNPHPILNKILNYRNLAKLKQTYCGGLTTAIEESDTDRVHPEFSQIRAITGRLTSSKPNLQTIPKSVENSNDVRGVFVSKPGYYLVEMDYSQIELRVLAHYSRDIRLIDIFNKDECDIHRMLASAAFRKPESDITEIERNMAKELDFGIIYGRGVQSIAEQFKMTIPEAIKIRLEFLSLIPDTVVWMDKVQRFVIANGYVKNMFGRKIPVVFDTYDEESISSAKRKAVNYPIQGFAADITNLTASKLRQAIKLNNIDANIVLNVHDSLILETKEEDIEKLKTISFSVVNDVQVQLNFRTKLKIKIKKGLSLADQKEF